MNGDVDGTLAGQLRSWFEVWLDQQNSQDHSDTLRCETDEELIATLNRVSSCASLLERVWGETAQLQDLPTVARAETPTGQLSDLELPDAASHTQFGRFEIRRELGRGAFGIVFLAFDPDVGRDVALKLPRAGALADPGLRERFQREARAAGRLDHPNLIPVYESGRVGAIDYLSCPYCPGPSLSEWQRQQQDAISPRLAAEIVSQLAEAVHYAHSRGILHRDLKPGNVLLQPEHAAADSHTDSDFPYIPRVADFGLARNEGDSELTHSGELLGTASFMSPEQAMSKRDLDETTDVYALGAILYQLLTGQPPFGGDELLETLQNVQSQPPIQPHVMRRDVPRDVEAICLKCLEKVRHRRYQSARELSVDLQRFLAGEPTHARPVSAAQRLLRWTIRFPAASALIAILTVISVAVPVTLVTYNRQLETYGNQQAVLNQELTTSLQETARARDDARSSQTSMRRQLYIADLQRAKVAWEEGDVRQYDLLLTKYADGAGDDLRGIEWHVLAQLGTVSNRQLKLNDELYAARYSPTGGRIAAAGKNGVIYVVDPMTLEVVDQIKVGLTELGSLAFAPDGIELAVAGMGGLVQTWNLTTGELNRTFQSSVSSGPTHVAFSVDGTLVAAAGPDAALRIWDRATGKLVSKRTAAHKLEMQSLAASPDRKWFAATSSHRAGTLFSVTDQNLQFPIEASGGRLASIDFSHDGRFAAGGSAGRCVSVWDVSQVVQSHPEPRHRIDVVGHVSAVCFLSQSYQLVFGDRSGGLYLLDMEKSAPENGTVKLQHWRGHDSWIHALDCSRDGSRLLSASADGVLRIWDGLNRTSSREVLSNGPQLKSRQQHIWRMALFPDRQLVATAHSDAIRLWQLETAVLKSTLTANVDAAWDCVGVSPDGSRLAASTRSGEVVVWDAHSLDEFQRWRLNEPDEISDLRFNHDSSLMAIVDSSSERAGLRLFDVQSGESIEFNPSPYCNAAAFSPDGSLLAVDVMNDVQLWNMSTMKLEKTLSAHQTTLNCIAFHPEGGRLATCSDDRTIRVWDVETGEQLHTLEGHRDDVNWIEFSPDGHTLLSAGEDKRVIAWHVESGQMAVELYRSDRHFIRRLAVSQGGRHLVVAMTASHVRILDAIHGE